MKLLPQRLLYLFLLCLCLSSYIVVNADESKKTFGEYVDKQPVLKGDSNMDRIVMIASMNQNIVTSPKQVRTLASKWKKELVSKNSMNVHFRTVGKLLMFIVLDDKSRFSELKSFLEENVEVAYVQQDHILNRHVESSNIARNGPAKSKEKALAPDVVEAQKDSSSVQTSNEQEVMHHSDAIMKQKDSCTEKEVCYASGHPLLSDFTPGETPSSLEAVPESIDLVDDGSGRHQTLEVMERKPNEESKEDGEQEIMMLNFDRLKIDNEKCQEQDLVPQLAQSEKKKIKAQRKRSKKRKRKEIKALVMSKRTSGDDRRFDNGEYLGKKYNREKEASKMSEKQLLKENDKAHESDVIPSRLLQKNQENEDKDEPLLEHTEAVLFKGEGKSEEVEMMNWDDKSDKSKKKKEKKKKKKSKVLASKNNKQRDKSEQTKVMAYDKNEQVTLDKGSCPESELGHANSDLKANREFGFASNQKVSYTPEVVEATHEGSAQKRVDHHSVKDGKASREETKILRKAKNNRKRKDKLKEQKDRKKRHKKYDRKKTDKKKTRKVKHKKRGTNGYKKKVKARGWKHKKGKGRKRKKGPIKQKKWNH